MLGLACMFGQEVETMVPESTCSAAHIENQPRFATQWPKVALALKHSNESCCESLQHHVHSTRMVYKAA